MTPTATTSELGTSTVQYDAADGVATITLNRPEVFNAFNDALSKDLIGAIKTAEKDSSVGAIVITGAGKAFCSGQDLGDLKKKYVPGHVPHLGDDLKKRYDPIIKKITSCPKPIIAAVNGAAAGAGCSLALACDMRIASDKATFIEIFIMVGLIPDSASTWFLPRLVGLGRAMELCMTGRPVKADEAAQIGLVNKVVPADQLLSEAQALGQTLAHLPARGIALTKKLLLESAIHDVDAQLAAESFAQETAGQTADHFEGVTAFIEKRKPKFTGQ